MIRNKKALYKYIKKLSDLKIKQGLDLIMLEKSLKHNYKDKTLKELKVFCKPIFERL